MNRLDGAFLGALMITLSATATADAPAVGDTYVYRVTNGYNHEVRGEITYRIEKIDGNRVFVSVSATDTGLGMPRTEVYTPEGNWLKHPLVNHDRLVEYDFSPPYPAYQFPLDTGKSWSVRVTAINPATGARNSVRVDGDVRGNELVHVPAGTFDTIKITRSTYAGDWDGFRWETNINETVWLAPTVWRPVRVESSSAYTDPSRCDDMSSLCGVFRGDWNVLELISYPWR